jgi:acylphosphatase
VAALVRLHAVVRGDVQGVGFRYWVADQARAAGLRGWVRNSEDGSVECLAEGSRLALEELLRLLRRGPSSADVQRVDAEWAEPAGDLEPFQIRGWGGG